jgi:hypothetical protein
VERGRVADLNSPGVFPRCGITFPVLAPLPNQGKPTMPTAARILPGPCIYALYANSGSIEYIGVATEEGLISPLDRWIRPNKQRTKDFWAHGTNKKSGGVVVKMAEGLSLAHGPYSLYYTNHDHVRGRLQARAASLKMHFAEFAAKAPGELLEELEHALIYSLQPRWNGAKRRSAPKSDILRIADYWNATEEG